ncbi:hypothetical protein [Vibrio sp. TRT 29B02]|uniref:hypothetical protein n=1 Tax=Vibrio sp. TRT 29B02 TaxID=3418508 RepID=UPI003CFA5A81
MHGKASAHHNLNNIQRKVIADIAFEQWLESQGKENRTNNPYPVNDWLLSLPREKQASVVVYLYSLAESRCLDSERDKLIDTLENENEQHALTMLKKEGWLNIPVYGELATSKQDKAIIELTEDDKKALTQLTEQHYLPFNGIGMGELLHD